jgi:hypothetical protein
MDLSRLYIKDEVVGFEREGAVAEQAPDEVVKAATQEAIQLVVHEIHAVMAKEAADAAVRFAT